MFCVTFTLIPFCTYVHMIARLGIPLSGVLLLRLGHGLRGAGGPLVSARGPGQTANGPQRPTHSRRRRWVRESLRKLLESHPPLNR